MITCSNCGNQNPDYAKFCGYCGQKLSKDRKTHFGLKPVSRISSPEPTLKPKKRRRKVIDIPLPPASSIQSQTPPPQPEPPPKESDQELGFELKLSETPAPKPVDPTQTPVQSLQRGAHPVLDDLEDENLGFSLITSPVLPQAHESPEPRDQQALESSEAPFENSSESTLSMSEEVEEKDFSLDELENFLENAEIQDEVQLPREDFDYFEAPVEQRDAFEEEIESEDEATLLEEEESEEQSFEEVQVKRIDLSKPEPDSLEQKESREEGEEDDEMVLRIDGVIWNTEDEKFFWGRTLAEPPSKKMQDYLYVLPNPHALASSGPFFQKLLIGLLFFVIILYVVTFAVI